MRRVQSEKDGQKGLRRDKWVDLRYDAFDSLAVLYNTLETQGDLDGAAETSIKHNLDREMLDKSFLIFIYLYIHYVFNCEWFEGRYACAV